MLLDMLEDMAVHTRSLASHDELFVYSSASYCSTSVKSFKLLLIYHANVALLSCSKTPAAVPMASL
jgi:hypothetical protein